MNYSQLRSFHAVAREGSATAASRVLGISQPTITTQIKELELEFGIELFQRRGRGLELTLLGEELLLKTQLFFSAEDTISELLGSAGKLKHGNLRIGAVGPFHVMRMISGFQKLHPAIQVSVDLGNSREVLQRLREYRTDVAVLSQIDRDPEMLTVPYTQQRLVVFVGKNHPWNKRKEIHIEELEGRDMVMREQGSMTRRAFEKALETAGVTPNIVLEIGSREAVWEAVAEGLGIGVVSEASLQPDKRIAALTITNPEIYTYTHVVCLKERGNSRLVKAFLDVIRDQVKRNLIPAPR
jgi:LysR family transcriptional regulator, low CO2-responsive transcriptional regulator